MALKDLQGRVPAPPRATERVDIGAYLDPPAAEGEEVLVFQEPRIDGIYAAAEEIPKVRRKHPLWHNDKCFGVLLLGQCHREPAAESAAEVMDFYSHIAEHNDRLYVHLLGRVYRAFPWLTSILGAAEEKGGHSEG